MQRKIIVSIDSLFYFVVFFLNFISFQNVTLYNYIKYLMLIIGFIYCLLNVKTVLKCIETKKINVIIILLLIWCVISSFYQTSLSYRNSLFAGFVNYLSLIESIIIIEIAFIKNKEKNLIKCIYNFFLFFLIIQLFEILIAFISNDLYDLRLYLFGNKFSVCAIFFKTVIFKKLLNEYSDKQSDFKFLILILLLIIVSKMVFCTTYLLVGVILLFIYISKNFNYSLFNKFSIALFMFFLSLSFVFWYPKLFEVELINNISSYFGENLSNLSGRKNVYTLLPKITTDRLFVGYGYGTSYDVLMFYSGTADAQNGFWELIVNIGLVGAVLYSFLLFIPFMDKSRNKKNNILYIYIIINIIIAFIEVPYVNSLLILSIMASLINKFDFLRKGD